MREDKVHGNLDGIRDSMIKNLAQLYQYIVEEDVYLPHDLCQYLCKASNLMNREICIYVTRDGEIVDVSVGTDRDVQLRDYRLRRNPNRLSGVRCIHTHPNGDGRLSDVDLSALRAFKYDAMTSIGALNGEPTTVQTAFLESTDSIIMDEPVRWYRVPDAAWLAQIEESDRIVGWETGTAHDQGPERAVLMGIESEESLAELARLANTAGAEVVGSFLQKRDRPDGSMFIGAGRAEELARQCQALECDVCIFDEELTGIQVRNLEDILRVKVVDRTTLILDIFAQRATSSEGKLQVELAQLQYQSTRLIGQGVVLSRLAGGIGTRGPGETKLEVDRRRIYARIHDLESQIDAVQKNRHLHRRRRKLSRIPLVALVGYTNAGKSTLLNRLTGSEVFAEDKLFATLDPTTRHLILPEKQEILLTDTVGFIQKLPHTLVKAFRATLEEVQEADLLLHVVDCSNENYEQQIESVVEVLKELDAVSKPTLYVFNKADRLKASGTETDERAGEGLTPAQEAMMLHGREGICVSAQTGTNLDKLQQLIERFFSEQQVRMELLIPFAKGRLLTELHDLHAVRETDYTEAGTLVKVSLPASKRARFEPYEVHPDNE